MAANNKENMFKRLSLVPAGMRYKLMIVFCLMSIIPLLICVYIASNFVFPFMKEAMGNISLVVGITLFIAILGYVVARRMIEPIIDMALEAKLIAGGDFERSIEVSEEGEVGDLALSLNSMSDKIRQNLSELKDYGEKTREINAEINKKVMVLSGLLQVGNLISAGSDLESILDILVEKVSLLDGSNPAAIMIIDKEKDSLISYSSINVEDSDAITMPASMQHGIFARFRAEPKDIIIDNRIEKPDSAIDSFRQLYKLKNVVISPIMVRGNLEGAILLGNHEDNFNYKEDDIELLHVFAKQAAIAIENDHLIRKTEELEVKDELTQLFNNKYITDRLEEEIKRGILYQRPCSFILFNIDDFKQFCEKKGRMAGESVLKKIGKLIASELSPVDKAARFSDDEFCLVLPERSKKEAKEIAEDIKKKISELKVLSSGDEAERNVTVSAGLSENPIDGVSAKELISKAQDLLSQAKATGKNRVKV